MDKIENELADTRGKLAEIADELRVKEAEIAERSAELY